MSSRKTVCLRRLGGDVTMRSCTVAGAGMLQTLTLELAHAQLVRELFPDAPLKYMPPTKHMTGNVFAGYLLDAFFNLAGVMTDQSILLIGMMTEGIHTPFLSDRDLALENVHGPRVTKNRLRRDPAPQRLARGGGGVARGSVPEAGRADQGAPGALRRRG